MWLHHCLPAITIPEIISLSKACLHDYYYWDPSKSCDGNKEPGFQCWCCWIAVGKDPRSVSTMEIMMTLPCLMGKWRHRRSKSPAQMKLHPLLKALQHSCFSLCSFSINSVPAMHPPLLFIPRCQLHPSPLPEIAFPRHLSSLHIPAAAHRALDQLEVLGHT